MCNYHFLELSLVRVTGCLSVLQSNQPSLLACTSAEFQKCGVSSLLSSRVVPVRLVHMSRLDLHSPRAGGCRLTDMEGSDRRTDPERKPVAMLMKHRLSATVLSVAGSAKLRGERVDFSSPTGRLHFPHQWKLDTVICH